MTEAGRGHEIIPARNGLPVVYKDGRALHSSYDPVLEAEKFIDSLSLEGRDYPCFVLIEPGLGYIIPVLQKKYPAALIIALHCSSFFEGLPSGGRPQNTIGFEAGALSWNPESGTALEDFLEDHISDASAAKVRVLEWRPAAQAYGRVFVDILAGTAAFLKRASAGAATVRAFGRRWLRNALRNLGIIRRCVRPEGAGPSALVCASGPALNGDMRRFAGWKGLSLLAVSSAAPCLLSSGLIPDLVVSTDGGCWALLHLYQTLRLLGGGGEGGLSGVNASARPLFAFSLSAAIPSQAGEYPVLLLADGSVWQRYLLGSLGLPFLAFPQRGTVSASAIDLALFLAEDRPVFVSGLDLRHEDLKTHCRPYSLDRLMEESADRFKSGYSQAFAREGLIRSSGALSVYASWFKREVPKHSGRLFALGENSLGIPVAVPEAGFFEAPAVKFFEAPAAAASGKCSGKAAFPYGIVPLRSCPGAGIAILLKALHDPALGKSVSLELGELLGTEQTADTENELIALEKSFSGGDQER